MSGRDMEYERNLLDYVYVLVKWRRLIVVSVLAVSLVTAGITLILPNSWTARTSLLPPEEDGNQFGLSSLLNSALPAGLGGAIGAGTSNELLSSILKSDRIMGTIVDQFELVQEYDAPYRENAIETLRGNVAIELGRDGLLELKVNAPRAQLAADMANAFARQLDAYNQESKSQQARALGQFLKGRLQETEDELSQSGRVLQKFQEKYGIVDFEGQANAAVDVVKNIVFDLTMLETKLGVSRKLLAPEHAGRRRLELEVEALSGRLDELLHGQVQQLGQARALQALGPPMSDLPERGFEYARLSLNAKMKEEIVGFLGARLEEARLKEAKNTPTLQVLDAATPPKVRTAPRRTLIVLLAAALSLIMSTLLAFLLESWKRLKSDNQDKLEAIDDLLKPRP